jgi:hypothetical protein
MPVEYARYFIEITGVKAERLQDISDEDCLKVGIVKDFIIPAWAIGEHYVATYYYEGIGRFDGWDTPREAYAALIDEINGQGTWRSNPWMWVYDFKPIYISNQDKHD